jgi:NAD(P)-dependent dehydrogenase (short-subunit alcohol dehydrogenase family)
VSTPTDPGPIAAPTLRVDGRVAVVTGASTGLGERFARVLNAAGASLVLGARRAQPLTELAAGLRDALVVPGDIRDPQHRADLVAAALDRFGRIDILVNNAGIAASGPAEDESPETIRDLFDTNAIALYALTQLIGRHMLDRGRGCIVNVASPSATTSLDRYPLAGYAASKGAVLALTRELAAQWAGRGVRVNALSPCFFPSNTSGWLQDPDQVDWISRRAPIGRPPRPEELDGPLLFLVGDASTYITGQNLVVDGGWTTR